jgi:glycosyltransferase involved in cell wall biosynthesis
MDRPNRLKIVHVVRSPIGGIFRHIVDLVDAQTKTGHDVGIICDSLTGGRFEHEVIASVASRLALGVTRFPMRRSVSLSDFVAVRRVLEHLGRITPDVLHCHGAKGGAYGRLIAAWLGRRRPIASIYAPHGGSLHYDETSLEGMFYFRVERMLERVTDALIHVSGYEAGIYRDKIGIPRCRAAVIRNGLREEEFVPVTPRNDARDLLFLGMLRDLKGVDLFLEAIARIEAVHGRRLTALVVGQAEEPGRYESFSRSLGIAYRVLFSDADPAGVRQRPVGGRNRCHMSSWRPSPRACRSSPPMSAASPRYSDRPPANWSRRAMRRRSPAPSTPRSPIPPIPTPRPPPGALGCIHDSIFPPCRARWRHCTG